MRSYCEHETYRKALRKRAMWVEPLFAEAKEWRSFRRLRRLKKVNAETLLTASGRTSSAY